MLVTQTKVNNTLNGIPFISLNGKPSHYTIRWKYEKSLSQ